MLYDLHVHTTDSDGKYSRLELLKKANEKNLKYISFTDHDFISDKNTKEEYENIYGKSNVQIINGVEFTVDENKNMHVIGYDIKNIKIVKKKLEEIREKNVELCFDLIKKINNYYHFDLSFDEYPNFQISKALIRRMIFDKGYTNSILEAGIKYTSIYSKFHVETQALKLYDIIKLVKESNGILVLAHPCTIGIDNKSLDEFIKYLKDIGLDGIEILNLSKTTEEQMKYYKILAQKYNLLTTCGSDFHEDGQMFGIKDENSKRLIKMIKER